MVNNARTDGSAGTQSPTAGTDPSGPAASGVSTGQSVGIAWYRARAFAVVGRAWGVDAVFAPWLWALHLATVGWQGDQIRQLRTASMAVSDGRPHRAHLPSLLLGIAALTLQFVLLVVVGAAAAVLLSPTMNTTLVSVAVVLLLSAPLLLECVVGATRRLTRDRESLTINSRRDGLAKNGPALVMSSFVRAFRGQAKGDGAALLWAMKAEWRDRRAIVLLYPANEALVCYYRQAGAEIDAGAARRMSFDLRDM